MALREVNQEWDRCLSRFLEHSFKGAVGGLFVGMLFFKRRLWCTAYFSGLGAGCSYYECEKKFKSSTRT